MAWRFLNSGLQRGSFNMRVDEALADALAAGGHDETVRIYGWAPPAISLGWHQSLEDIDVDLARSEGIDVVRRPTGGRAILHAEEVTYCVAMLARGRSIAEAYREISLALLRGIRLLGVDAALERGQPDFREATKGGTSGACFSSMARSEIKARGRKLVGSAQRRYARADGSQVVLQHGSILLGDKQRKITEFLRLNEEQRAQMSKELAEKTTDLSNEMRRHVEYDEVAAAVRQGFETAWRMIFTTIHEEASLMSAKEEEHASVS